MRRTGAVLWHASFSVIAAVLYFFFVLPRWFELTGETSTTLGTVLRIVTGLLIGLAALPVVFTLLRTRRPEFGTPQLALNLRTASIVLQVAAGVLIIGTAISEIWLSLDAAGQWLFGIYGAAAALALLGIFAFYLAFVAELPPPPPKPLKPAKRAGRRSAPDTETDDGAAGDDAAGDDAAGEDGEPAAEADSDSQADTDTDTDAEETAGPAETPADDAASEDSDATEATTAETGGKLRNRRPAGKTQKRRRLRGGVVVDD